jgi:hypothetical protein
VPTENTAGTSGTKAEICSEKDDREEAHMLFKGSKKTIKGDKEVNKKRNYSQKLDEGLKILVHPNI